jgi:hypothetical protein
MNRKRTSLFLSLLLILLSCEGLETAECLALCAGNEPVYLELIENSENLLATQDLNAADFELISLNGDSPELLILQSTIEGTEVLLELRSPIWAKGTYVYVLKYGGVYSIPLTLKFETSTGACCGGMLRIQEIVSDGYEVIRNPGGYYTLFLN